MRSRTSSVIFSATLLAGALMSAKAEAVPVAVYGANDPSWNNEVKTKILNTGLFNAVDAFPISGGSPVPTLAQLSNYAAVFVYSDGLFNDNVAVGNVLADYMDGGGGVVIATFAFWTPDDIGISGRIATDGYLPFTVGQQAEPGGLFLIPDLVGHPILFNVNSFNGGTASYHNTPITTTPGATLVAHWNNDQPLIATKIPTVGKIVGLNFYPPSTDSRDDFWVASTDGANIMANALAWAAGAFTCDADGDGVDGAICGGTDCNDADNAIHPGATEVCDGIDNNCNGQAEEGTPDLDLDNIQDACDPDDDGDGVDDASDNCPLLVNPGQENLDGDALGDVCDPDRDGDGALNDNDNCPDAANVGQEDSDGDGLGDACDDDIDEDGLSNDVEIALGTNPANSDSDGDFIPDIVEVGDVASPDNTDGTGPIDAIDTDSDGDGLSDAEEAGDTNLNTPPIDTDGDGIPNYKDLDSDNDSIPDNTDVCNGLPGDPCMDVDGDGLYDDQEIAIGSSPSDADSDDDGAPDGQEITPLADSDGDGIPNVLDADSDNDGLFDGTELGLGCAGAGTDNAAGNCIADADMGASTTSPVLGDTDDGGASDGAEDWNHNGKIDAGEQNPLNPADDALVVDSDGDGLSDNEEILLGGNPNDTDSDDDGVSDGNEVNPSGDADGDGVTNVADADSDNDGLFDGTELGLGCTPGQVNCVPDADGGLTTTNPLDPDSDGSGVLDGAEDKNKNGQVDPGESNPGVSTDDICTADTDCVTQICEENSGNCVLNQCDPMVPCPAPSFCQLAATCEPATGQCVYPSKPNGTACDDGKECTIDTCKSGSCVGINVLDGFPCENGTCIAGFCAKDSPSEGGSGQGAGASEGGSGQGAGMGEGGSGQGAGASEGGNGQGANGQGGNAEGGSGQGANSGGPKASNTFQGGGFCATTPVGSGSGQGLWGAMLALATWVAARRRQPQSTKR